MKLALIAALARNRVIGNRGKLPWHIPADMKRFRSLTTGHSVIMGRKTFDELGKPLPKRRNIVVSRSNLVLPGAEVEHSIERAVDATRNEELVFIIGGGEIYAQTIERADVLYLTHVHADHEGDAFFPPYEHLIGPLFTLARREVHQGFEFADYVRLPRS